MKLSNVIAQSVEKDLELVNELIYKALKSNVPMVEQIGEYLIKSGGKRLRPILTLLVAKALGYDGEKHISLATLIEFMHTSTLLHDDVVDSSSLRRGKPTANSNWNNAACVLVGDFLYSRSFEMMVEVGNMSIMATLSHGTCLIAEGEVDQLANIGNINLSKEKYYEVIGKKTGVLFAVAAKSATILAGADIKTQESAYKYAFELGLAFQIIDDWLDYAGDAKTMGKAVGDDFAEGKMTLPLIYLLDSADSEEKQNLLKIIKSKDKTKLDFLIAKMQKYKSLDKTYLAAQEAIEKANGALADFPSSNYKNDLLKIANLAINRNK